MPLKAYFLAIVVMAIWGSNFTVIAAGLQHWPAFFFVMLRFMLSFGLLAFFIKRPKCSWRAMAAYGVAIGAGQFGLLFFAIDGWISPGLASLVVQMQVFFTIALAAGLGRQKVRASMLIGLVPAVLGIVLIAANRSADVSYVGVLLVLLAGFSWAIGNSISSVLKVNMLGFMVWSSLFAIPPLLLLSLVFEAPLWRWSLISDAGLIAWGSVFWQAIGNTLFGYTIWGILLHRYPVTLIAPMALLVPVFGMVTAVWFWDEAMPLWKLIASALVFVGLAMNTYIQTRRS